MKCCTKCGETKPLEAFTFRKDSGQYRDACKLCRAAEQKARRDADPARAAEIERRRYEVHGDARRALNRAAHHRDKDRRNANRKQWYRENREHSLRLVTEWYHQNKHRSQAYKAGYEAMKRQAVPPWADRRKIAEFYKLAQFMRDITGDDYHVDHIVPLRGALVCGLHTHNNLRVVTAEENMAKHNALVEHLACTPST